MVSSKGIIIAITVLFSGLYLHGSDRYVDNGDGTITDTKTGLMWVQNDSFVDTGRYMNWQNVKEYVAKLRAGGYDDWRIPTIAQYLTIYDPAVSVKSAPAMPTRKQDDRIMGVPFEKGKTLDLHFSPVFTSGGAIWFWSSDEKKRPHWYLDRTNMCFVVINFANRYMSYLFDLSSDKRINESYWGGGVRAVRPAAEH